MNYWTGSAWSSLGTIKDIGWSYFTATGLTSSIYTIQLKGALESSDASRDIWNIDTIMLRTWNTTGGPYGHGCISWSDASNTDKNGVDGGWNWSFNFLKGVGYYKFYSIGRYGANNEAAPLVADSSCYFTP